MGVHQEFRQTNLIAGLAPKARIAQRVEMVIALPMMSLSGATISMETPPEEMCDVTRLISLTNVVTLLRGLWLGDG